MAQCGAEYILVHFPYFKHEVTSDVHQSIEKGLQRLSAIQSKYIHHILRHRKNLLRGYRWVEKIVREIEKRSLTRSD